MLEDYYTVPVDKINEYDLIKVDAGFTCLDPYTVLMVHRDGASNELYVNCACGMHKLDGQLSDDGLTYIGLTNDLSKKEL